MMRLFDEWNGIKHAGRPMHMLRILFIGLVSAAIAARAPAQTNPPAAQPVETRQTRVLTLEEAVRLALQHNLDIQISRYEPLVDLYNLNGGYGAYDPAFSFSAVHSLNVSPAQFNSLGVTTVANERNANTFSPLLSGTLPTGLTYKLTTPLTEESGTRIQPSDYTSFQGPTITLSQPILKNFWIDTPRLTIALAKNLLQ